ncbi:hypothetical protein BN3590_04575 [Clostridium sp. C105KSO15]|nr:hypothetical protein BN3590_04575 [Clostridium sp. C105KSO15]
MSIKGMLYQLLVSSLDYQPAGIGVNASAAAYSYPVGELSKRSGIVFDYAAALVLSLIFLLS